MARRERIFWIVVGGCFAAGVFIFVPGNYDICNEAGKAQQAYCTSHPIVPFLAIKIGRFLDAAGAGITAIATIAIACFTLTLKLATDKLWDAGKEAANAAFDNAETARNQGEFLVAAERAYIVYEGTRGNRNEEDYLPDYDYGFTFLNVGKTAGFVTGFELRLDRFEAPPNCKAIIGQDIRPMAQGHTVAASGKWPHAVGERRRITPIDRALREVDGKDLYVFGVVVYKDIFNKTHETWFCRVYRKPHFAIEWLNSTDQNHNT